MLFDVCAPAAVASAIANAKVMQFSFRALIAELLFKSQNGDAESRRRCTVAGSSARAIDRMTGAVEET